MATGLFLYDTDLKSRDTPTQTHTVSSSHINKSGAIFTVRLQFTRGIVQKLVLELDMCPFSRYNFLDVNSGPDV